MRGVWIEILICTQLKLPNLSHLVRGVWIEILKTRIYIKKRSKSHLVRGVWIEIPSKDVIVFVARSHLVRGVWIEIIDQNNFGFDTERRTS